MTRERKEQIQATILVNTVHCIIYCYDYGSRQYGNMVNVTPIFLVQGKILTLILLVLNSKDIYCNSICSISVNAGFRAVILGAELFCAALKDGRSKKETLSYIVVCRGNQMFLW